MKKWHILKFLRSMPVKRRLTLAFVAVSPVPFLVMCTFIVNSADNDFKNKNLEYAKNYSRQSVVSVNRLFELYYGTFESFSKDSDILADVFNYTHNQVYRKSALSRQIENTIRSVTGKSKGIDCAIIYTEKKDLFYVGLPVIDVEELDSLVDYVSDDDITVRILKRDSTAYMLLAKKIKLRYDQPDSAIAVAVINLQYLNQVCKAFISQSVQEIIITDSQGTAVIHPNENLLGRVVPTPEYTYSDTVTATGFNIYNIFKTEHQSQVFTVVLIIFTVGIIIWPLLMILFKALSDSITQPAGELLEKMDKLGRDEDLGEILTLQEEPSSHHDENALLNDEFNAMVKRLRNLIETVYLKKISEHELEFKIKELELNALQQQINPHFLYNVLDTIFWMAQLGGSDDISEMVTVLGSFFKTSTDSTSIFIPIERELLNIKSYIYLQKTLLGDRFDVQWDIDDRITGCKTVKLILQPIIENTIVHGFKNTEKGGLITIRGKMFEDSVVFEISDNGIGMNKGELETLLNDIHQSDGFKRHSVGLRNVSQRLKIYYGDKYGIKMESKLHEGTTTRIVIPVRNGGDTDV